MPIEILMPALSPTMTTGNLAKWLKKEGDKIKSGDILAEIETDKATMEIESIDDGILGKILVAGGSRDVPVNQLIALILEEGESLDSITNYTPKAAPAQAAPTTNAISNTPKVEMQHNNSESRIKASPLAKRIASDQKIDLSQIIGSGPSGRIVKDDVLSSKGQQHQPITSIMGRNVADHLIIPHSNIRRVIAERLTQSKQNVPHFYLSIECNIDKLLQMRAQMNEDSEHYKLSINDFVIKAAAAALKEVPEANASWSKDAILQYNNIDISVAVAIEGGLITPIIHNADQKSISILSNEMKSLAKRARENALKPEEFQGGGFSISNLGMYGIKQFIAIVNPPQACILAVGASNKRPIVINDQLAIATVMDVSLSCDHRVVDGAVAAKFMASFKKFIEQPAKMFA